MRIEVERVRLLDTVTLDGNVERSIVWLFSQVGGGCAVELPEEDVINELKGSFAAWKICDGLFRLREQGVAVSNSQVRDECVRRCWQIVPDCWGRISADDLAMV